MTTLVSILLGAIVGWGLYVIFRGMMSSDYERYVAAREMTAKLEQDAAIAAKAQKHVEAISEAYHIHFDCKGKTLCLHPNDSVVLPYIVMANRDARPMRLLGMQVSFDRELEPGQWRIES